MNESYSDFSSVYDELMDNIPYTVWHKRITELLKKDGINSGILLELGCGTGTMTELLAKDGYDMIGVDNSEEMLNLAQAKKAFYESNSLYLNQDMREFELYGTVNAIISICDSINYITDKDDLLTVFKLVNNYLDPKGLFIFDIKTEYYYKEIVNDSTIAESRDNVSFIWDNIYDEESKINELLLTLFLKVDFKGKDELYKKHEELHYQYGYTLDEIKEIIKESGLIFVEAFDEYTKNAPHKESERILIVARENGK